MRWKVVLLLLVCVTSTFGQKRRVRLVDSEVSDALECASFAELDPESKFLYVTSWRAGTVRVYARDKNGGIELAHSLEDDPDLQGITDFKISADGLWAVASCWTSKSLVLFSRDPKTGKLKKEHANPQASADEDDEGMAFPIDCAFSRDGKFAYAADCSGRRRPNDEIRGTVVVFKREGNKLVFQQNFVAPDDALNNIRGLVLSPDQKTAIAACMGEGTLVVMDRDVATGKLKFRQSLSQASEELSVLNGAFTPTCSPDGKFVYTASGRFLTELEEEPHGVGVFRFLDDGKLEHVQSISVAGSPLHLRGCNQLQVSRDGKRLFVSGTGSGTFTSFLRNQKTGKLLLEHEITVDKFETLAGANGIAESHDGKHIYVTGENAKAINVMRVYQRREKGE